MGITIMALSLVCRVLCVEFGVGFLLGDKQKAKFGGVMSS